MYMYRALRFLTLRLYLLRLNFFMYTYMYMYAKCYHHGMHFAVVGMTRQISEGREGDPQGDSLGATGHVVGCIWSGECT